MLTRLTLTILDYAVNDARQFEKRTKTVQLNVNDDGSINYEGKGVQITATLPIDAPSDWVGALDRAPAYREFLARFPTGTAQRIQDIANRQVGYDQLSLEGKKDFWKKGVIPDNPVWGDSQRAVKFIKDESSLAGFRARMSYGSAVYVRRGTASDGLQQFGQRLGAALAPSSPTGR